VEVRVDPASLAGFVLILIGVFLGMVLKGADPVAMFTNLPALLIVIVGAIGAVVLANPLSVTRSALTCLKTIFLPPPPPDMAATIAEITEMAEQARREGLLALEQRVRDLEDPFLQTALQMVVDGLDTSAVSHTLLSDVKAMRDRHKVVAGWFTAVGVYAPSFGIIGAVVGLIAVMGKLDDPAKMGYGIAAAFVATFWGVFMANGMFLPWAAKLKAMSAAEVAHKMLIVDGVLALQRGASPSAVAQQLSTHIPPAERLVPA
jgi:chemotaxis protein MotA